MSFQDLREYIKVLELNQELCRVKNEIDWNLEIGAITRRAIDLQSPALLFEKIRGYDSSYKVLGLPIGPSKPNLHGRMALALGLHRNTPANKIVEIFTDRLSKPIKPRVVSDGPCKENIVTRDDIDVLRFPAPWIHAVDGGRYIGTWHICVTESKREGWVNWGIYRVMVHSKNILAVNLLPNAQHGGAMYYGEYSKERKAMPIALALGTDPVVTISGATSFPLGSDQPSLTGGMKGEPIEVVKCETSNLLVPASSEIVIEGEISPGDYVEEGPFGEFTGHSGSGKSLKPAMRVKCITFRNDPILTVSNMGKPWDDCAVCESITRSAVTLRVLREAGLPVKSVFMYPGYFIVISANSETGLVHKISRALNEAKCRTLSYWTLIVGEDIDPTNLTDVLWSLTTRTNPKTAIHTQTGFFMNELYPFLEPQEREGRYCTRAILDSTFPTSWTEEYKKEHCQVIDFEHGWPKDVQEKVLRNWSSYGLSSPDDKSN